ncbi:MAG: acetoin utilization protein AcuC [Actinomycetota bacterium]|nr:acetoin utilization protein AcuC [Actinomycetota bacterium]
MSASLVLPWDEALVAYDFGPSHPLNPIRVDLTMRLARAFGLLDLENVHVVKPEPADDGLLELVHERDYIEAVRRVGADPSRPDLAHGLGTPDNPAFAGMHEAAALVTGASVRAAQAVWTGESEHAVNVAGGLHHAMAASASGFCVYNDPAIAIAWLLEQGAERIAYVDVDVHHGDGVERAFWDDPRVLTISIHESGRYLFPGTGFPEDTGGPGAEGYAVNVALQPSTADSAWLRAFHAIVPPLLAEFEPGVLVTQQGCDSHVLDPLAHLGLTVDGQRTSYAALHRLAHEHAGGKWVAFGGGGYELVEVVPRAWSHLISEAAGAPIDPGTETPAQWREHVASRLGVAAPSRMTDGATPRWSAWSDGFDPADPLDRAVLATQRAVFPAHGLGGLLGL